MSAEAFTSGASWSWPKPEPSDAVFDDSSVPGSFTPDESTEEETEVASEHPMGEVPKSKSEEGPEIKQEDTTPPKVYLPRTCRICLEVVQPTYNIPTEGIAAMLNPAPKVEYISQEPESGRLISPCKCKGSQRYVHEGCLQEWRHADPAYGRRNFWQCPTCHFKYRLERMRWSRWISSTLTQVLLTIGILFTTIFLLGFVADPIINLYLDPVSTLTTNPLNAPRIEDEFLDEDEELSGWAFHIIKGLTSLGLLGFVKVFLSMGPIHAFYYRSSSMGARAGRGGTGRDRMENISWYLVIIGVTTFLWVSNRPCCMDFTNNLRLFGKVSDYGVVERSRKQVKGSSTSKVTPTIDSLLS